MSASFGRRLKAARAMAGLSMDALVERMGRRVSKQAISKYENDRMNPDGAVLGDLSRALGVKPDFFFSRYDISLDAVNFRKKASLGARAVESLKARIKDRIERYAELESLLPDADAFSNPLAEERIAGLEDIERVVLRLREAWGLGPEGPIGGVVDLLEDHAIRVIETDEGDGFDGLSGWVDSAPFIVLNAAAPPDRKRLTALHEFAHLTLEFDEALEEKERERLCHTFGAAFLLPRDVLRKELGTLRSEISWFELGSLKEQYGLSMQAVLYRARQRGILSEAAHQRASRELSARGWRKKEPVDFPMDERPARFERLLHRSLSEELISASKAAYLAGMSLEEFRKERMLQDATPHP